MEIERERDAQTHHIWKKILSGCCPMRISVCLFNSLRAENEHGIIDKNIFLLGKKKSPGEHLGFNFKLG